MSSKNSSKDNKKTSVNFNVNIDPKLSKGEVLSRYYSNKRKHYFYGLVSFLMTAMFYIEFTSPSWIQRITGGTFSDAMASGAWAFLGLLFSGVITALIMHAHSTDNKQWRYGAYAMILILSTSFNVFTETASSMDRVDERVLTKSRESDVFRALTHSIANSSGDTNKALLKAKNDYADAVSTKRARCKKGSTYNKKLCTRWTMRADEYKTAITLHSEGAKTEKEQTVELAGKAEHQSKYAQAVIKLTMETFKISYLFANLLVTLFIILTFEVLGMMIGADYRRYRDALPHFNIDLNRDSEIKYLKQDLKRQNDLEEAENQYQIDRAKMQVKRMADSYKSQIEIEGLRKEIAKLKNVSVMASPSPAMALDANSMEFKVSKKDDGSIKYGSRKKPVKSNDRDDINHDEVSMYKHACNNMHVNNMDKQNMDSKNGLGKKQNMHDKSKKLRLSKAEKAKKGSSVHCPECGNGFIKKTYNHTFCKPSCRDEYHNGLDESGNRLKAKKAMIRKRKVKA